MSEIKLILIDSESILEGTIHGSVGDRCVAALSAEPETIPELKAALARYERDPPILGSSYFHSSPASCAVTDIKPYDAGILIIDLAARIVACESTYSRPGPEGRVDYHDGTQAIPLPLPYRVPDDWIFQYSVDEYEGLRKNRLQQRAANPPFDARAIIYGRPLLEFIVTNVLHASVCPGLAQRAHSVDSDSFQSGSSDHVDIVTRSGARDPLSDTATDIHSRWLLTPREDLRGQSPRTLLLLKQAFIDFDLESRSIQWSFQLEGPPCLPRDSFAYRFAGFGYHEWVIYYYLVRHLIRCAFRLVRDIQGSTKLAQAPEDAKGTGFVIGDLATQPQATMAAAAASDSSVKSLIARLDQIKIAWLTEPCADLDNRVPFIIIDNERKRLPEAMGERTMVVDESCPICRMMGDQAEAGLEIYFWHLDGCNMDDEFAFSTFLRIEDWEDERRRRELFSRELDRMNQERKERTASYEQREEGPWFDINDSFEFDLSERLSNADLSADLGGLDESSSWIKIEPELPEA